MSALDRNGLVHETIEHLIDQVTELCKERDALQAEVNMRKFERDEARGAYDALWTCFNDCAIELKAQHERGDTYRRRTLALQLRAKSQRGTIKILQSMLKDTILERNALKKQVDRRDHWIDETLNSGNGTYRP